MVVLSKSQQKNKKIETLIDDLWDLNKHGIEFKFEMNLEFGNLVLDNTKMNCMMEKQGLAAAVYGKYMEIEKLPNPLSKLTQIQAYNWLQTQIRLDQKVVMGSILKDRVAFGEEESRPSFWSDEILPWTSVKKTFKNLHVEHPGLINKVKAMIAIRLNGLGKNPEFYVASRDEEASGEQIVKMPEYQTVEVVAVGTSEANGTESIEGEEETTEASSGATRATTNSPGASPRAPSEVGDQGSISTDLDDTLEAENASKASSSDDEESGPNETLQLVSKKLKLEQQLKTVMLGWSTSSCGSVTTRENSPAKEKDNILNKKCKDCKFRAKTKTLLQKHIRAKHPFNLVDSDDEKPTAPRQSKRTRKTTKRDLHIYDSDTDWEEKR